MSESDSGKRETPNKKAAPSPAPASVRAEAQVVSSALSVPATAGTLRTTLSGLWEQRKTQAMLRGAGKTLGEQLQVAAKVNSLEGELLKYLETQEKIAIHHQTTARRVSTATISSEAEELEAEARKIEAARRVEALKQPPQEAKPQQKQGASAREQRMNELKELLAWGKEMKEKFPEAAADIDAMVEHERMKILEGRG